MHERLSHLAAAGVLDANEENTFFFWHMLPFPAVEAISFKVRAHYIEGNSFACKIKLVGGPYERSRALLGPNRMYI
jgi:hypothetical protein